jgi:hypothetical protein
MKKLYFDDIENLLDLENPEIKTLYNSWDKGDCSMVGLIRILMIQEIHNHIRVNDIYYDGMYDEMLENLETKYKT